MRLRSTLAVAAAAAIVLGALGCKPSSLTPFGLGTRGPESSGAGVNGTWQGTTSSGGTVAFQVGDDRITTLLIDETTGDCTRSLSTTTDVDVVDDAFTIELALTQGRVVIAGRFTSSTTCSGSYSFEGLAIEGTCPTRGTVSFTASKAP
jgi:hypothetical protein